MIHSEIPTIAIQRHDRAHQGLLLEPISEAAMASLLPVDDAIRQTIPYEIQGVFDSVESLCAEFEYAHTSVMGMRVGSLLVGFNTMTATDAGPEVTHYITRPEARGKGYGTLAKLALADFAFGQRNEPAIVARSLASNRASNSSLRKTGFLMVGSDAQPVVMDSAGNEDIVLSWRLDNPSRYTSDALAVSDDPAIAACRTYLAQRASVDIIY